MEAGQKDDCVSRAHNLIPLPHGSTKGYLILSGDVLLLDFQCIIDWEPDFMKLNVNI